MRATSSTVVFAWTATTPTCCSLEPSFTATIAERKRIRWCCSQSSIWGWYTVTVLPPLLKVRGHCGGAAAVVAGCVAPVGAASCAKPVVREVTTRANMTISGFMASSAGVLSGLLIQVVICVPEGLGRNLEQAVERRVHLEDQEDRACHRERREEKDDEHGAVLGSEQAERQEGDAQPGNEDSEEQRGDR